jgi:hypothetical protein
VVVAIARNHAVRRGNRRRASTVPEEAAPLVSMRSALTTRKAYMVAFRNAALGLPTGSRQRLDDLQPDEVRVIDDAVRCLLTALADSGAIKKG